MTPEETAQVETLLLALERIAGGEFALTIPLSTERNQIDAIAYGINILVGELRLTNEISSRAKEAAEAASRAKSRFLRNVSHELRTPLMAIVSLVELLQTGRLDKSKETDLITRVHSNGRALLAIINDILDLSKVEAGKLEVSATEVAPLEVLSDVTKSFFPETEAKSIRIEVEVDRSVPSTIITDGNRLRQILMNVIGNAIKFTEKGSVRVSASADDSSPFIVEVEDSGIGIAEEERGALFEPFGRAKSTVGGTGLGLALSQRLARELGGDLELVRSLPGKGSTFRIRIGVLSSVTEFTVAAEKAPTSLDGMRLLLAEDNEDIRYAVAMLLELKGASVVTVSDGAEAVTVAEKERFDVILMDMQMPVMDGLEATRALRARGNDTPIWALTADAMQDHREICLAAGCNDHVAKPIELDVLFSRLSKLTRK